MRLYIRYEYKSPSSASFLSSFHVYIEGISFFVGNTEEKLNEYNLDIAQYLESIQVEALMDKKSGLTQTFEWDEKRNFNYTFLLFFFILIFFFF